ncbi:MAG: hypothetical protein AAFS10_13250 [Myxococcota bacterium]
MGKCRSCGAPIEWRKTPKGKLIPVDAKTYHTLPVKVAESLGMGGERRTLVTKTGIVVPGTVVPEGTPGAVEGQESHFATCPNAKQWRR